MVNRSRSITERRSACAWRRSSVSRWSSTFARSNSSRATHTSARARADGGKIISISARRRESDSRGPEDHTPDQAPGGMSAPDAGAVRANLNLHVRDIDATMREYVPIGQGVMDLKAIADAVKAIGFTGVISLEQDGAGNMKETCRRYISLMKEYLA